MLATAMGRSLGAKYRIGGYLRTLR
jgi:hypothetical protein